MSGALQPIHDPRAAQESLSKKVDPYRVRTEKIGGFGGTPPESGLHR